MLQGILFFFHLVISFLIVVVVLLQRSKGGGLSGAFGGVGAGDAAFGGIGVTTFLHKATIYLAIGFMFTSLSLVYLTAVSSTVERTGGSRPAGSEIELPVGNTPVIPEESAVIGGDSTAVDTDAVVPGAGDIVPVTDDEGDEAATDTTATGGTGEGGQ